MAANFIDMQVTREELANLHSLVNVAMMNGDEQLQPLARKLDLYRQIADLPQEDDDGR